MSPRRRARRAVDAAPRRSGPPALSGMFTRAEATYAWRRGTARSGPIASGRHVHRRGRARLSRPPADTAIEAMLNELAAELGAALGQERIDVAFADRTWILDAGEHARGA